MKRSLWVVLVLLSGVARGGADTAPFGDGHAGAVVISADRVVNRFGSVQAAAAAGALRIQVSMAIAAPGDLVMLWQMPAPVGLAVNDAGVIDVSGSPVGQFELVRVAAVEGAELVFTEPLLHAVPGGTQAVFVPEYSALTIPPGHSILTAPWDGVTGGLTAVLVAGAIQNDGVITASGQGFRGATTTANAFQDGCQGDELPAPLGAPRGESFAGFDGGGQAAGLTGGGGGVCAWSGGGGGAHWGAGGRGGGSTTSTTAGGAGGWPVTYDPSQRLIIGGGSGAGWNDKAVYQYQADGLSGGGVVWVRAKSVLGAGTFEARGSGNRIWPNNQGTGVSGGGGGGAVILRAQTDLQCGSASAEGGAGNSAALGATAFNGGGGGGGLVWLQGAAITCPASAEGGARIPNSGGRGGQGLVVVSSMGLDGPSTPTIETPMAGATVSLTPMVRGTALANSMVQLYVDGLRRGEAVAAPDGRFSVAPAPELLPGVHFITVSNRVAGIESGRAPLVQVLAAAGLTGLRFTSAPRDTAVCGSAYHYARAGVPTLEGAVGEVTFSIEGDAPPTMSVDPTSGALTWLPTANQTSDWRFELIAADTVGQARQTIDILVECPGQRPLKIGCACAEASDAPVLFAAVWWWYRSRKRRDRRCALPSVSGRASS